MIAIGGSIGTGLLFASGATVAQAGRWGITLWRINWANGLFSMTSLWELAAFMPVSAHSQHTDLNMQKKALVFIRLELLVQLGSYNCG